MAYTRLSHFRLYCIGPKTNNVDAFAHYYSGVRIKRGEQMYGGILSGATIM